MHIQRILFGAFLTAFLSLVFLTTLAYLNLKENHTRNAQEKISLQVLKSVEELYNNLQDMEQGAITYSEDKQTSALQQYTQALALYPKHLQSLQQAQVTDRTQISYINKVSQLAQNLVPTAEELVSSTRENSRDTAAISTNKAKLRSRLDTIKTLVHLVEEKERDNLHLTDDTSTNQSEEMLGTFVTFSGFMFIFFLSTYWFIYKNLQSRNKAAAILKEKEQLYSNLFYKSPIMLAIVDVPSGRVLDTNEHALNFFGHTRDQVIGSTAEDLEMFLDPTARERMMEQAAQEKMVRGFETQVRSAKGIKHVAYNIDKVLLNGSECLLLAFEDITQRKLAEKKLRESEALFSTIFYKSPIMKSISEANTGIFLDVNENCTRFFGYTKEEVIGKTSTELNLWKSPEARATLIKDLQNQGTVRSFEIEARTVTGEIRHISVHAELVNLDGQERLVAAFIDITEKKKADELIKSLNLSLEKSVAERIKEISDYKYALDQSSIVAITDKEGYIIYANDNFCTISEYSKEELIGQNYRITRPDFHSEAFFHEIWQTVSRGKIWKGEIKSKAKSGTYYWTETTIVPILDEAGTPYQFLVIRWDITAKKDSQEALLLAVEKLEKSEARLKEAQTLSHLGSWEFNLEDQTDVWSDEIYRILGTTPSETKACLDQFLKFVHPEDAARVKGILTESPRVAGKSYKFNYRIIRQDGTLRYLYNEFKVKLDQDGKPYQLTGITHDVTKERLAQLENERITSDLLQRNKDLEQFAYIVSHNLRAPVANIMGLSHLIRTLTPDTPTYQKSLEGLETSVEKLDNVIKDLSNVLQIRQEVNEKKEIIDLEQLVEDIKSMTASQLSREDVSILTDFSDLRHMYTIKSYLHSIFSNLISNSIKYRQPSQRAIIRISAARRDGRITISFQDNGLGIDLDQHKQKVFGLYKRFHFHTDGKGMGLFMVKTQVETLGGKIDIQSAVNQGTQFIIEFEDQQSVPSLLPEMAENER
ncbi:PAS domain S-box protein [Sabulibacter ruber]|uniref:PAS domain S-box protein n=1 Tax=Sabulibacter ruber TaxID=2811901 RepID=UPI001A978D0B|nr:PAS domain S-box protein [Sabulibacter ruber]